MSVVPLAALAREGGEGLLRTNPVLAIDRLLVDWQRSFAYRQSAPSYLRTILSKLRKQGIALPRPALRRWADAGYGSAVADEDGAIVPNARVVGLGTAHGVGYVVPLRPVQSTRWDVDATLPFTGGVVLDLLVKLLRSSGVPVGPVIPERLAFRLGNPLGLPFTGSSMTVACALSILDTLGGSAAAIFRCGVALVEPDSEDGLRPVADVEAKLDAATRECGRLSLVVAHPDTELGGASVETTWRVTSLAELAGCLHSAGALDALLAVRGPLNRIEAAHVLDRLRAQVFREHRFREAAELGDRVRQVGPSAAAPDPAVWTELARLHAQACRHHGRFADATGLAAETSQRLKDLGDLSSDDDKADAAAEHAAAMFSSHRFTEIPRLLSRWAAFIRRDPRRFRPLTRVKVWNTMGRALAVLGSEGWDAWLSRALDLNRVLGDTENVARTTHYRVLAWLRHKRLREALLALSEGRPEAQPIPGEVWGAFLSASVARLEGRPWEDRTLEERLQTGEPPYAAWAYVQATARQPGRSAADVQRRLRLATHLLTREAGGVDANICHLFAGILDAYAAARIADTERWAAAIAKTGRFLKATDASVRQYYEPDFARLSPEPDVSRVEALVERVPYF